MKEIKLLIKREEYANAKMKLIGMENNALNASILSILILKKWPVKLVNKKKSMISMLKNALIALNILLIIIMANVNNALKILFGIKITMDVKNVTLINIITKQKNNVNVWIHFLKILEEIV